MASKSARRNMDDALSLTPKAMAFISEGSAARSLPKEPEPVPVPEATETNRDHVKKSVRPKRSRKRKREGDTPKIAPSPALKSEPSFVGQLLVTVTTRLQPKTAEMLHRACLEQKLAGKRPNTQQEIIELATQSWLKDNGYL